ncbi:MAG: RsmB/NOP family class I SAM-dependent RNA methyltransferase [Opitutaceae bacterium]|jgi:16S rRNA (cytosine967-C5)-methyltransferase
MSDPATLNHAARVLATVRPELPADAALRRYLAGARHLGPRERRSISGGVFAYFRWIRWLDPKASRQKQVEEALAMGEKFERDPRSVKPEALAALAAPPWLREEMELPVEFLRQLQREPVLWLRARPGTAARLAAELGDCATTPLAPDALRYNGTRDLFLTPQFQAGAFEIQDLASQLVGHIAAPDPGQAWWDACAGEGGKTLHLADLLQNRGVVWATDRSARRLEVLKRRTARARLFNYRTAPWDFEGERNRPARLPFKTRFDGVLVDAPCSGVGTWRRNPHARWTTSREDARELSAIQASLLRTAAGAVGPGGILVYAVCTLTRSETTEAASAFSESHPEFEPEVRVLPGTPLARAAEIKGASVLIWPQSIDANGMFVAAWRRKKT